MLPIVDHGVDTEDEEDLFKGMCCARIRRTIWRLTEDPDSSGGAKVLVIMSSLFLLTSIIMLILSTVPEFQVINVADVCNVCFDWMNVYILQELTTVTLEYKVI